ncbi:MAG: sialate O-acetylesterase [Akkermansiaceae bacterium]
MAIETGQRYLRKKTEKISVSVLVGLVMLGSFSVVAGETVKVFILAGQSNMEGKAGNSLLEHQAIDPKTSVFYAPYRDGKKWIERNDVSVTFLNRHGPLTIGYGSPKKTGPELAFGWVVGDHFEEPVLLIKAAWGGHSLYQKFRSPSAGLPASDVLEAELEKAKAKVAKDNTKRSSDKQMEYPTLEDIKNGYGVSYRAMMEEIDRVLGSLDSLFPSLKDKTPEIAGFFWFQGFNDQFGDHAPGAYESNMKHFIEDVRKDLKTPDLPFVIGAIGTFGVGSEDFRPKPDSGTEAVWKGQMAMNQVPEFKGNVKAFETAPLVDKAAAELFPTWKDNFEEWKKVGSDRPYHYLGSGIWYSRIGKAAGEAMVDLLAE